MDTPAPAVTTIPPTPPAPPAPAKSNRVFNLIGWYGAAAILLAYFLTSYGQLTQGVTYQLLNLTGALGVSVVSIRKKAWQPATLNTAWAVIAFMSLMSLLRTKP